MKAFLRRPGGVDQYPDVSVSWKLHHDPVLHAYDATGRQVQTVALSKLNTAQLHELFTSHFRREEVEPPSILVRTWRRLFGWAYGISFFEATLLFVAAGVVVGLLCYAICFRYTAICDTIQDI